MEATREKEAETTVEVAANEPAPQAKAAPTREELKSQGWSAKELEAAEKRGMIAKAEEKKVEEKKPEPEAKAAAAAPEAKAKPSPLPDADLTPEQEEEFKRIFGSNKNVSGLYFSQKRERNAKTAALARVRELEARLQALEAPKPAARQVEVDEAGNEIDPDDKPMTVKQLREMQKADAEAYRKQQEEHGQRSQALRSAQTEQEEYARSIYPDFDAAVPLAKDLMMNLDALVPNKADKEDVLDLIEKLQIAAANADKIGLDERHAAVIAYKIAKFHPQYGKEKAPAEGEDTGKEKTPKDPKANGGLTTEQMKRIEANTQRRASSASVADGGGKRTVSVEDVDMATLNKMSLSERMRFREKHPDRYAKLLRG